MRTCHGWVSQAATSLLTAPPCHPGYSDITYFALERWESYQVTSYSVGLAYEDSEADVLPGGLITSSLTDDCAVTVLPWADFLGVTGNTQACESEEAAVTTVVPFSLVYTTNESTIPGYPDTAPGTGSARRQLKAAKTGTVSTYPDASLTAVSSSSSSQLHRRFLQDGASPAAHSWRALPSTKHLRVLCAGRSCLSQKKRKMSACFLAPDQ